MIATVVLLVRAQYWSLSKLEENKQSPDVTACGIHSQVCQMSALGSKSEHVLCFTSPRIGIYGA